MTAPFNRHGAALLGGLLLATAALTAPIGWRTDGTGSYPKADPPIQWSSTENVVWKTPMPGYGVAHPVIVGKRLFACSEPATLLCLNKEDGEILWQKTCSYSELNISPEVQAQLKVELEATADLKKKQSAVSKEMDALYRDLKKANTPDKEIGEKLKPYRKQIEELEKEKQKLTVAVLYTQPNIHTTAGCSAATPVTDGKNIWVVYGNGLTACYDLDGNRQWLRLIEHSNASFAHSGSPVLAGGNLIVHYTDLVGLDPKTGAESWRLKLATAHGTSLVARIGDDDVLFTPKGALVRARDGKLLVEHVGSCGANSPVLHDDVVYYVHSNATAVRVPASVEDLLKPKAKLPPLWKGKAGGGGYGFCSPVVHDGLVYAADDPGILTVLDAATGKLVYDERLGMKDSTYPSISVAGDKVFVSSENGTTVVLQAGREYKELARNKLETFRSSLVFEGKRVYVRTAKNLYCIGK